MSQKARVVMFGIPIMCLFLAIAIPNLAPSRVSTAKMPCIAGLRMIDGAKVQWALTHHSLTNDAPTWDNLRSLFLFISPAFLRLSS